MSNYNSTISSFKFSTDRGENIVAAKKGNKVLLKGDIYGRRTVSPAEFLKMLSEASPKLERAPKKDTYIPMSKRQRDKELMRSLLYSNPMINPFGYMPTKNGFEPIIKNPMIESALNSIYGKD